MLYPPTKMTVHARVTGPEPLHEVYEGEAQMSQQQQDAYKALIGDGLAKVTVGRDIGEKDFGSGGGVIVNVSLTCDQSGPVINQAIALAHQIADGAAWHYQGLLKEKLLNKGILR